VRAEEHRLIAGEESVRGGCPGEGVLARFLAGRLDRRAAAAVLEHVCACDDCRRLLFAGREAERDMARSRLSGAEADAALAGLRDSLGRGTDCPECGEPISPEASFCYHSGTPQFGEGVRCLRCGTSIPAGARFCPNCGCRLGGALRRGGARLAEAFERLKGLGALNAWLLLALASFVVSFMWHRRFWQFLILTLVFGLRWALAGLQHKTLVMIYEAWRRHDELSRR